MNRPAASPGEAIAAGSGPALSARLASSLAEVDFARSPFIVFWELTRSCALACRHCRAEAQPKRHPAELTTQECFQVVDQIAACGNPILVLTGGDPMMRRDLLEIVRYAIGRGLRVSLSPSATKLLTRHALERIREERIARVSISLDGATAEVHDAFRGVRGSYQRTQETLRDLGEVGLSFQMNTTVCRFNVRDLEPLAEMAAQWGAVEWSVFLLVPTGRAQIEDMLSAQEHEQLFHWLYDLSLTAPYQVKTTCGMHYRRVALQRSFQKTGASRSMQAPDFVHRDGISHAPKGTNDGNGVCFISHVGEVCPSGFLPIAAGSVRERPLGEIYREAPLFQELRDSSRLRGKCGRCEYNTLCGGSRARAYAVYGDYLAEEPCCIYQPGSFSIL